MRGKRVVVLTILVFMIILSGGCVEENKKDNKKDEEEYKRKTEKMIYVGKGEKVDADTFLNLTDTTTYKFKKKKDNKEIELEYDKLTWTKDDESKKKFDNLKEGETYTVEYYNDKLESVVIEDKKGKK